MGLALMEVMSDLISTLDNSSNERSNNAELSTAGDERGRSEQTINTQITDRKNQADLSLPRVSATELSLKCFIPTIRLHGFSDPQHRSGLGRTAAHG
jgi:hypothetical protein